ncbi:FK506-binding protein 4-like [Scaptodrosophila lebanonensis]|uniref:FK506-binding protein 4-like n=1 Tax=Drosophila lebanonensis TaxID=7225 RepID=A0A6J2TLW5_DROLE|nr:FK506-binding protein 4-like [Scaptodrosophila lebanonensis]
MPGITLSGESIQTENEECHESQSNVDDKVSKVESNVGETREEKEAEDNDIFPYREGVEMKLQPKPARVAYKNYLLDYQLCFHQFKGREMLQNAAILWNKLNDSQRKLFDDRDYEYGKTINILYDSHRNCYSDNNMNSAFNLRSSKSSSTESNASTGDSNNSNTSSNDENKEGSRTDESDGTDDNDKSDENEEGEKDEENRQDTDDGSDTKACCPHDHNHDGCCPVKKKKPACKRKPACPKPKPKCPKKRKPRCPRPKPRCPKPKPKCPKKRKPRCPKKKKPRCPRKKPRCPKPKPRCKPKRKPACKPCCG